MFATRVRESPCSALWRSSSDGRDTVQTSPSTFTPISGCIVRCNSPFGPFTATAWPFTVTVTPFGMGIGSLPIRDMMFPLPYEGEQLAARTLLPRFTIRHQPAGRAEDRDAQTVPHARDLGDGDVLPEPGARHAPELANHRLAALRVLEHHTEQRPAVCRVHRLVVLNEVVFLQQAREFELQFRCRNVHATVLRSARIADPRQHVGDRGGHTHEFLSLFSHGFRPRRTSGK